MGEESWSIYSARKLSEEESTSLQNLLRPLFPAAGDDEDINDIVGYTLAMVSNHKDVNYIVKELNSMGLEEACPPEVVQRIGGAVCEYLKQLFPPETAPSRLCLYNRRAATRCWSR